MVNSDMKNLILPLPPSPDFARACETLGRPVRSFSHQISGQTVLHWQIQSRPLGPLGQIGLISRGPVARPGTSPALWLDQLHERRPGMPLLLNAEGIGQNDLRDAGFWPIATPCTLAMLSLTNRGGIRRRMSQKWRNRLTKAETQKIKISRHNLNPNHWVLRAEAEQARERRYRGLPPALSVAFAKANPNKALVWQASVSGLPVAAILILRHGRMATWQVGVSRDRGRALNAMNLLLWTAMGWLADQGHEVLDLGMINTDHAAGLAHYKLGTGAQVKRLGGTWLHAGLLAPIAQRLPIYLAA